VVNSLLVGRRTDLSTPKHEKTLIAYRAITIWELPVIGMPFFPIKLKRNAN
jgi:hypothetical protein